MFGELKPFIEAGSVGVALASIGALIYLMKIVLKLVGNHINHSTDAIKDNAVATRANIEIMKHLVRLIETKLK